MLKAFGNLSVDGKIDVLNETPMYIFRNYIPNKKVKCNYCQPPWMNGKMKKCLRERSKVITIYYKHGQKKRTKKKLQPKAAYCTRNIMKAENRYILRMTSKLNDSKAAPETYWSILNQLLYNKKIPSMPPLVVNNKLLSGFCIKANLFK